MCTCVALDLPFSQKNASFSPLDWQVSVWVFLPVIAPCNHIIEAEYRVLRKGVLADEKLSGFILRTTAAKQQIRYQINTLFLLFYCSSDFKLFVPVNLGSVLAEFVELLQCHMSAITTTKKLTVWIISA